MVKIEEDKLIIEVEHPSPTDFAADLKVAIISAVQTMELANHTSLKEYKQTNITLLELLKYLDADH